MGVPTMNNVPCIQAQKDWPRRHEAHEDQTTIGWDPIFVTFVASWLILSLVTRQRLDIDRGTHFAF